MVCAEDAIAGAKDIIAESISDEADYRSWIRKITMKKGKLISTAKDPEAESVYEMYYEFEEPLSKLAGHRILALNRGEKEKILTVKIEAPEEEILGYLEIAVVSTLKTKESYSSYYSHQNKSYPPIQQFFHISFIKLRRKSNSNLGYSARTLLIFNLISSQRSGEIVVPIT